MQVDKDYTSTSSLATSAYKVLSQNSLFRFESPNAYTATATQWLQTRPRNVEQNSNLPSSSSSWRYCGREFRECRESRLRISPPSSGLWKIDSLNPEHISPAVKTPIRAAESEWGKHILAGVWLRVFQNQTKRSQMLQESAVSNFSCRAHRQKLNFFQRTRLLLIQNICLIPLVIIVITRNVMNVQFLGWFTETPELVC